MWGAWSCQQEATGQRQAAWALPVFQAQDGEGVFGQRGGGSEQLESTRWAGGLGWGMAWWSQKGKGGRPDSSGKWKGWARTGGPRLGGAGSEAGKKDARQRGTVCAAGKALGLSVRLSSPRSHCCFSDLRGRNLRGPVAFLVATAAVKPTRQHRDVVLNLSVSSQLGEAACRYCSARCSASSRAHRPVEKASILRSLRGEWE